MSRMLRAVRHLREAATKYSFSLSIESLKIHLDEPATIVLDLSRGPRRVRGSAAIEAAKGDNELSLHIPLHCNATLFKPKSSTQGGLTRKRNKQQPDAAANADDAIVASSDPDAFQPKEAKLQVIELSRQRRLGGRLLSRVRPSPSTSLASVLPRDPSASGSVIVSPEAGVDAREAGAVVAEAVFDLAGLVAAQKAGTQRVHLPLTKAKGSLTMSFSCTKLEANVADEDDCLSMCSVLVSPPLNSRLSPAQGTKGKRPLLLKHIQSLQSAFARSNKPALGVMRASDGHAAFFFGDVYCTEPDVRAAAERAEGDSRSRHPTEYEVTSTGTPTTPIEVSPAESQRWPLQEQQQEQQQQQQQRQLVQEDLQQRAELRRKDELIASLQRQVALMEAEDRQAAAPQLAQLFAQIDELHTALAAAQEQQLATAEQLQQEKEKADSSATAELQQQLQAAKQQLQHHEQQNCELQLRLQELQQKYDQQQQLMLQVQAEKDGMQLLANTYKKEVEDAQHHQQQQSQLMQQDKVVLLLQQIEQQNMENQQLHNKLSEERKERDAALKELRLLQQLQQQQPMQHDNEGSEQATALQNQIASLQRQVVEAGETREALRASKDQTIADLTKALQEMQHKQGQTQTLHQQALQKLNSYRDEAEALREKIRCQEETLQRLPTQAAWSCAQQQHQLLLQQQREWQQQQQEQQRHHEQELAAKSRRIEELEKDLVHAKVELAAAEQRRHEDIDAFKKKLQMVKDTVVAYAVASSSNVQAQPTVQSDQNKSNVSSRTSSINGKGSPVRKLVHISSLKAFFRSNVNPSSNSSNSYPVVSRSAGDSSTLATAAKASSLTNCEDPCIRATPPETRGYKGPPAPVTLFGSQPQPGAPVGPSVTRFCASSGGGCSVLTSSLAARCVASQPAAAHVPHASG
ncbi:uncharacterized protein LOC34623925 [Cyclospora cayetanensis]|uniref:Uncharacterized protein LOC34623925 n=1 Tax=Cyclospora cayetanensis TaxID=88456 RepID=A0A6P6RST0_9EIME|nr:uncharacterized protein LOC34623925 [Cyclospora cayetanensis]